MSAKNPAFISPAGSLPKFRFQQQPQAQAAQQEVKKFSAASSPTLDLVAQAGRDRLQGDGNFG